MAVERRTADQQAWRRRKPAATRQPNPGVPSAGFETRRPADDLDHLCGIEAPRDPLCPGPLARR